MTHYKKYTLSYEDFAVKIDTDDNDDIEFIQVYNNRKRVRHYQYVFPDNRLFQDIKEAFLDDRSIDLEITEGS